MLNRRHFLAHSAALAAIPATLPLTTHAQAAWPAKPIKVVIPYAAGGVTDSVGRKLIDQMAQALGQPMVVENKGGAGGTVGMAEVLKAQPDGYTLALTAISPLTLSPHLMKLPYDPRKDVVAIAPMMYSPVYVLATPAYAGKTWEELIADAKAKPGTIRFATSGIGSVGHIMLEQIQHQTGAQFIHVPYKGVGQTVNDAVGGHFEIMTANPFGTINGLITQGKLRVLATTGPQRAPNQPHIATLGEKGVPQANITSLFGFLAPARTPVEIVNRLNALVQEQLATPAIQEAMRSTDNVGLRMKPQEFDALLQLESSNNGDIIRKAKITL